jgi:hypothetical protein
MMYDMMEKPPKPGSVLEALCLMVQMRRQTIQLYGVHTIVQAVRTAQDDSAESVQESFRNYQDAIMPYLKDEIDREQEALVKALKAETKRGPFSINALVSDQQGKLKNKLRRKPIKGPSFKPRWSRRKTW